MNVFRQFYVPERVVGFGAMAFVALSVVGMVALLDLAQVPEEDRHDVHARLRIMEATALPIWNQR